LQGPKPVGPTERILALDVLRGFAMFGVLVAYCMWSLGTAPENSWSRIDHWLGEAVHFAVDGKFYTILAFLFGLGFSIQLGRGADDASATETYCRRLATLAAIGLAHALLLRNSDILLPYALTGFLMIPFRRLSDRAIVTAAFAALLMPAAAHWLWQASGVPIPQRPHLENAPYLVENAAWVRYWYSTAVFTWPTNLTLFLFGLLAGRHRLLSRTSVDRRPLAIFGLGALVFGAILYFAHSGLVASSAIPGPLANVLFTFHCWGISSFYAATLLLALRTKVGARALLPLATIGRLALTNYLMQAALIVPLCLTFGWFDRFTPVTSLALALAVFLLVQLPFSLLWLRYFEFGPAEWLWRFFTYGRAPAIRRTIAVERA
jgi:uncharacterized protein